MDKVITTVLLTVAGVIAAAVLTGSYLPMVQKGAGAVSSAGALMETRIRTSLAVVHALGDAGSNTLVLWAKNNGLTEIAPVNRMDVFVTGPGLATRLPYGAGAGTWAYDLGGESAWLPAVTLKVTVTLASLPAGQYTVLLSTPNGVAAEKTFSV